MIPEPQRYILVAKLRSYLNQHDEAVRVLDQGIERNPGSPHLYRHRGHFKISQRRFDEAVPDFERAIEAMDGMDDEIEYYQAELVEEMERLLLGEPPELLVEPTPIDEANLDRLKDVYKGTLKSSTWYHYALAHYLRGDFATAADGYRKTLEYCVDDDMRVATIDWLYMSLRRAGREDEARELLEDTDTAMHVNEPSYHRRMRMYKGELQAEDLLAPDASDRRTLATQGYGVGNWYLCNGDRDKALEVFRRVIEHGQPAAFGYLASEVDLARLSAS